MVGMDTGASMSTAVDMVHDTDHDYQEVTSSSCPKNNEDALTLKVSTISLLLRCEHFVIF